MDRYKNKDVKIGPLFDTWLSKLNMWITAVLYAVVVLGSLFWKSLTVGVRKMFFLENFERPACLDDPALGTHGFLHLEDVRIHYVASGPEDKPLMLFVHGFPEFWYTWRHQIREFQKDYRVVAIDLRGYGESDKPVGTASYTWDKILADFEQFIRALGYKSCTLVGHDWGGALSWTFARLHPRSVDRLIVLNAPPFSVLINQWKNNPDQKRKSWYMFFFQVPCLPELMMKANNFSMFDKFLRIVEAGVDEIQAYKYIYSQPGALTSAINYYRAALQLEKVEYDLNYDMPVLLIWGARDTTLSVAMGEDVVRENPNIVFEKVESADHFVQAQEPEAVNRIIREWLERS